VKSIATAPGVEIYYDEDDVTRRIARLSSSDGDNDYEPVRDDRLGRMASEDEIDSLFGALKDDDV